MFDSIYLFLLFHAKSDLLLCKILATIIIKQNNIAYLSNIYVLTCLQDSWPGIVAKGFEPATFGSVFWSEAKEGQ